MSDTVNWVRGIIAQARPANRNTLDFRFTSQRRVDDLLDQLNAKKPRDHIWNRDEELVA